MTETSCTVFDIWHLETCTALIEVFHQNAVQFTIGQAQKWVNMTLKYIYVIDPKKIEALIPFLHIPIDQYIINSVKNRDGYPPFDCSAWSKITDYDAYLSFQKWFTTLSDKPAFIHEFSIWVDEAVIRE